jgi:hypothetical protein
MSTSRCSPQASVEIYDVILLKILLKFVKPLLVIVLVEVSTENVSVQVLCTTSIAIVNPSNHMTARMNVSVA